MYNQNQAVKTISPEIPRPESPFNTAISSLERRVAELDKSICELRDAIVPALRPEHITPMPAQGHGAPVVEAPPTSDVVSFVQNIGGHVEGLINTVNALRSRVEL